MVKETTLENHKSVLEKAIEWVASAFAFSELPIFVLERNVEEKNVVTNELKFYVKREYTILRPSKHSYKLSSKNLQSISE